MSNGGTGSSIPMRTHGRQVGLPFHRGRGDPGQYQEQAAWVKHAGALSADQERPGTIEVELPSGKSSLQSVSPITSSTPQTTL
jgi:hypothetical protein